jgi:hypothetical protein
MGQYWRVIAPEKQKRFDWCCYGLKLGKSFFKGAAESSREHDRTPRGPPSRAGLNESLACAFLLTLPTFHIRHRAHSNLRAFPKNTSQLVNLPIELLEEIISRLRIESLFCLATCSQRGTTAVGRDLPTHPELPPVDHLQKHSSWPCPISPDF